METSRAKTFALMLSSMVGFVKIKRKEATKSEGTDSGNNPEN